MLQIFKLVNILLNSSLGLSMIPFWARKKIASYDWLYFRKNNPAVLSFLATPAKNLNFTKNVIMSNLCRQ